MKRVKRVFIFLIITGGLIGIGLSPAFYMTAVHIHGNRVLPSDQVLAFFEEESNNIFLFNANRAIQSLQRSPYVYQVTITKDYLNRQLSVNIRERRQTAYVQFAHQQYVRVDRHGFVLSTTDTLTEHVPVVTGVSLANFNIGEQLSSLSEQTFYLLAQFADIFLAYNIDHGMFTLDPTDLNNIRLLYGNIVVNLGQATDLAEKIRIFLSIARMPDIAFHKNIGGQLNITNIYTNWAFRILT